MTQPARQTLLIFRLGSIGDTVVALPCFHAIARHYPLARRVLLTNSLTAERASSAKTVLDGTGLVDQVIYYPVGDFSLEAALALRRRLRRLRPQVLIYLAERTDTASVLRDAAFFLFAGVARIRGLPWRTGLRNCRRDEAGLLEYEAERLARTLGPRIPVSFTAANWDLRLTAQELDTAHAALDAREARECRDGRHEARQIRQPPTVFLAVAPGAKIAVKDWGEARWTCLLGALAAVHPRVTLVLVGAPDERSLCDRVAGAWKGPVRNVCGSLTPRETAAALRRCALLVCHDSGPMHLAAAQGTACVALFGNYNEPRQWYPYGDAHTVIYEPRGVEAITVERVAAAITARLPQPVSLTAAKPSATVISLRTRDHRFSGRK
jgi:ADP-heptose:LPS heptosyltransferase